MKNKIYILGSGTSTGIPMLGCTCDVCQSFDPKDKRLRTSICLETAKAKRILVDTSPDLRTQLLREKIQKIDSAIITHDHADHLHGIDDLRPFTFSDKAGALDLYTSKDCASSLHQRFPYIFQKQSRPQLGGGLPQIQLHEVEIQKPLPIDGEEFEFFLNPHGYQETLAFVHSSFAYIVDCHEISANHLEWLKQKNLELLIIDCVQKEPHKTHLNLAKSFEYIEKIAPQKAYLIHMGHKLSHQELLKVCHSFRKVEVAPSYDGQVLTYS